MLSSRSISPEYPHVPLNISSKPAHGRPTACRKAAQQSHAGYSQAEETVADDRHVDEVQQDRHKLADVQLAPEVERAVRKQVHRSTPTGEVGPPPPVIVLAAQLEVAQHDGDLRAREAQDDEHQGQEAEQVVELVQPHAGQDEEQLCRHSTAQHSAEQGMAAAT